ncbi:rRNA (cytidine-2'-O-)-methyltransferase, partial [Staphylococcus hominis]
QRMYQDSTLIIYESPFRVIDTLKAIIKVDAKRRVAVGRELTKKFEQVVMFEVSQLLEAIENQEIPQKGEFVILIEGAKAQETKQWFEDVTIIDHVNHYIETQNLKPKKAIKVVAEERQMKTSEIYDIYHNIKS